MAGEPEKVLVFRGDLVTYTEVGKEIFALVKCVRGKLVEVREGSGLIVCKMLSGLKPVLIDPQYPSHVNFADEMVPPDSPVPLGKDPLK